MIFYFSGTGNSYYAAKALCREGETMVDMAEAMRTNELFYVAKTDEPVGFVFPVYFYSVPSFVEEFLSKMSVGNTSYVYAVITCGGGIGGCAKQLKKLLWKIALKLNYATELLMPDNAMTFYGIPSEEEADKRLPAADEKLAVIKQDIAERKLMEIPMGSGSTGLMGKAYKAAMGTKKFHVEADKCLHCGLCAKNCPTGTVSMTNGLPVWEKPKCTKCLGCINRCPAEAIQYGKMTKKRNRYVNPVWRKQ